MCQLIQTEKIITRAHLSLLMVLWNQMMASQANVYSSRFQAVYSVE